jgi:ABC-type transporter Mla MlaB component
MRIQMNGSHGQLQGELTDTRITGSVVAALSTALQKLEAGAGKIRIDCARILRADLGGLRFLYVWLQCARLRGLDLELVNPSDCLQLVVRSFGLGQWFSSPAT